MAKFLGIWDILEGPDNPWTTTGILLGAWVITRRGDPGAIIPHPRFLRHFGIRPGIQNPSKIELLTDKVVHGWYFWQFLVQKQILCMPASILKQKSMNNHDFLIALLHCCTRFLKTRQTLKIVVLLKENDDFQQFAFSALSIFSIKKWQKSYSKSGRWKTL